MMEFNEGIYIFSSIATAIFLEAMPFLAIGALFSAVIEVYVPVDRLAGFIPKSFLGAVGLGVSAGLVIPTCECGVVPVVRRLMAKGVPPHIAIIYMLSAPIINPVVMASTYIAFRGNLWMVIGRVMIAAVVSAVLGFFIKRMDLSSVLRETALSRLNHDACCHHGEAKTLPESSHTHSHDSSKWSRVRETLIHAGHEFFDMGKYLIIGAFTAAMLKTLVPQDIIAQFSGNPVLAIFGMMTLAILLSVCSEADAFVAASFVSFPVVAKLSFVTIGPMVDLKLIGMFAATFQKKVFWTLLIGPTLMIFLTTLILGLFI